MASCFDNPGDTRTALFRIDVIEIPIMILVHQKLFPALLFLLTKKLANLLGFGVEDHGDPYDTQTTRMTNQCHDITVFPTKNSCRSVFGKWYFI